MSLSAVVGAPAPVTLAGRTYTASPVDLFGLGELEEWARAGILSVASKALAGLPPEQRDPLFDRALASAMTTTFDSAEFQKYLMSRRGMASLLSIALRPRHPDMTPEKVGKVGEDDGMGLLAAVETVFRISGLSDDPADKGEPSPGEASRGAAA